ncbi:SMC-Scp complex subunit ScpB [Marinigracilibium pacificum]|uniref:SMC-Scp complex subunit ScpB n=1 Tax=Marinigracilibium pacificum TaxID=2729599 RepID=A0A848IY30_9BACT|nr:SMC-Scp complex subunit ScpB [Marinigracilibium pacificum]NMM47190.1 SMC-Scp complex subunit ScpB [Marinigracilibium pacificum]
MDVLAKHIEALIFCSPQPLKVEEILKCLTEMFDADVPQEHIDGAIEKLSEKYSSEDYSFELVKSGGGYQFLTKPAYQASIGIMLKQKSKRRLSTSALETLSIIAYKQPITKSEVEQIRGVNCDYAVNKLLEKELVIIKGKADTIGKPLLYGTSENFMDYFGINSLSELPTPKDFVQEENSIGSENDPDFDPDTIQDHLKNKDENSEDQEN